MGVYGFSSSDDDAEYTPPNEDVDQDKDGDRYVILIVLSNLDSRARSGDYSTSWKYLQCCEYRNKWEVTNHRLLSRSNSRTNKSTSRRQSTDWARDSVWSCSKQEEWSLSWGKGRVVVSILYFCRYRQFVQGVLFGEHDRESTMDSSDEEFVPPVIEEDKVFMVRCLHDSLTNVEFLRERLMKSNLYEFICILRPRMHLFLNRKYPFVLEIPFQL